jgi:hypothetical protein
MGKQGFTSYVEVNVVEHVSFKHLVRHEFLEFNYIVYFGCTVFVMPHDVT